MEILLYFSFFLPIIFFLFIISAPLFIMWGGLKIFNIQGIPNRKIFIYLIIFLPVFFLVEKFLNPTISSFFRYFTTQIIDNFIYLIIDFLLLKYYFQISGKKLWRFLFYLIIAGLIFSAIVSLFTTEILEGKNTQKEQVNRINITEEETADWKIITNINGFSIKYPANITAFGQGIGVDETTAPIVIISEKPENHTYQGLFFQIDIHNKRIIGYENVSLEEISRENYEANLANKNSFVELIAPISLITLDNKPAYTYTIISRGFSGKKYGWATLKAPRKLKVIESDNNGNHFVIVYTPDDSVFNQIFSTFKFIESK